MKFFKMTVPDKRPDTNVAAGLQNGTRRHSQNAVDALIHTYSQSFHASREPVSITDAVGTIRYVNSAFCVLTGYSAAESLGKTPRILKSGKHDAFFYQAMWRHLLAGHTWQGDIVNRKKDGRLYVDEQTITPVMQSDGRIGCFISVRHDSSAKKKAEQEQTTRTEECSLPQQIDVIGNTARSSVELLTRALRLFLTLHEFKSYASGLAFEVNFDQNVLRLVVVDGNFSPRFLEDEKTVPLGKCLCGRAAVEGRVLVCRSCFDDSRHEHKWLGMRAHGHYTIPVGTPDRVLAVINLYTDTDVDSSERRVAFLASAGFRLGAFMDRLISAPRLQGAGMAVPINP